jgi:hypothetical protein
MADGLAEAKWFNLAKKQSTNQLAISVWSITGATRVDGNEVVTSDRKQEAVTEELGTYL